MAWVVLTAAASAQPVGVTLTITAPKSEFFFGEVIPLQLSFTSTQPGAFEADTRLQDRVGRLNWLEEFVCEPASLAEDPLRGLWAGQGGMGGLSSGPLVLSEKPFTFERVLNEWVRFRQPGEYRVHVVSRRVRPVGALPGKPFEVASNTLTLTIRPAPEGWVRQQIATAPSIRVLRFLESPAAAEELARRLDDGQTVDSYSAYLGVLASPYRKQVLSVMEQRLVAQDQPVWDRYLDTLAQLSGPASQRDAKRSEYAARLIAALPAKEPRARAISMNTLLNLGTGNGPEPPWLGSIAASLIAEFRSLPVLTQSMLLESRWRVLKGPAMLPLLREMLSDRQLQGVAMRRLFELAPDEGRKLILDEMKQPAKHLPFATLAILPDESLPELNDILAERGDALLILRYATGDIVKRIEAQSSPGCNNLLTLYFLKYDPAFGERSLRAQFAKDGSAPACYDLSTQFHQLGPWAYSPALEKLAIESLTSTKVPVKRGAAELLGKYGSAAAQKPLWEAMEYFHSWWKDREAELKGKIGEESVQLERSLRIALAQADGWVLQEPGLRRLSELCSSDWCRMDVANWNKTAKTPVSVAVLPQNDGFVFTIAQYGAGNEEWLRRKARQYPSGTTFQVNSWADEAQIPGLHEARERAEALVR